MRYTPEIPNFTHKKKQLSKNDLKKPRNCAEDIAECLAADLVEVL